jgi:peptidyl-prolyl cis-trans isomerase D
MLEFIRRHRKLFSIIFVIAAVGMVISLFGGAAGRGGRGAFLNPGVVGQVLDEKINFNEFTQTLSSRYEQSQAMLQQQLGDKANDPQMKQLYERILMAQLNPSNLLEQVLREKFQQAYARKLGFRVPDSAVRYTLEKIKYFQKDGHFDPILYREKVGRPGDVENSIRRKLLDDSLQYNLLLPLSLISQNEITETENVKQNRSFEILSVDSKSMPFEGKISAELKSQALKNPSFETEVRSYFDQHKSIYQHPAEVHARHILLSEKAGGQSRLATIRQEIVDKKITFEEAAKKYSEDTSNAPKGGDLGFFKKEEMDEVFSKAAFELKNSGDISAVIKSSFGFHIIQLVEQRAAVNKSFEDVKADVIQSYLSEKIKKEYAIQMLNDFVSGKRSLSDKDLKSLGAKWDKVNAWGPMDDNIGAIPVNSIDAQLLVSLKTKGALYPKIIPQGDKLNVLKFVELKATPVASEELRAEKANQALEYFLEKSFSELEKKKKVYRSEKIIKQLQAQMQKNS